MTRPSNRVRMRVRRAGEIDRDDEFEQLSGQRTYPVILFEDGVATAALKDGGQIARQADGDAVAEPEAQSTSPES